MAFNPKLVKRIRVTVGTVDHSAEVNNCTIVPTTSAVVWEGGTPEAQFIDSTPATWVTNLNIGQDWKEATSLVNFLNAHAGERAEFTYWPHLDGPGHKVEIVLVPVTIGGGMKAFHESPVVMPCTAPVLVEPFDETPED